MASRTLFRTLSWIDWDPGLQATWEVAAGPAGAAWGLTDLLELLGALPDSPAPPGWDPQLLSALLLRRTAPDPVLTPVLTPGPTALLTPLASPRSATITGVSADVTGTTVEVPDGGRTADATPTLRGSVSGALVGGEKVQLFNGTTLLGTAAVNAATSTWTFTPTLPATPGTTYTVRAYVVDGANALGPATAARSFTLDTVAPSVSASITSVNDDLGYVTGTVAEAGTTDDSTPTISGTLSGSLAAGDSLRVFNGSSLLGSASVNATAGTWSFTPTLPATNGTTYMLSARVVDAAGNLGAASATRSFTLNTAPPFRYDWSGSSALGSYAGIRLARLSLTSPRSLSVFCLRIDLSTPGLKLTSTGRAAGWSDNGTETQTQTTRQYISSSRSTAQKIVCAINADAFNLSNQFASVPANLLGYNVSNGQLVSSAATAPGTPTFLVDRITGARIQTTTPTSQPNAAGLDVAVSGFGYVLRDGVVDGGTSTTPQNARTGLGLSADRRYLYLMAIDRAIDFSLPGAIRGATIFDVGQFLLGFGAANGINLDGGGSTQMAWWNPAASSAQLLDAPLAERYVGNSLGVYYQGV